MTDRATTYDELKDAILELRQMTGEVAANEEIAGPGEWDAALLEFCFAYIRARSKAYRRAGSPYGPGSANLIKWAHEMAQVQAERRNRARSRREKEARELLRRAAGYPPSPEDGDPPGAA